MQTEITPTGGPTPGRDPRARWLLGVAAALLVVAGVAAAVVAGDGGSDSDDVASGPALELSLGAGDAMASCLAPEAAFLAEMPVAFAGTATEVGEDSVTLEVEEWYTDGDAELVELQAMGGQVALTAGFEFAAGERYLVSATDGTVNFCGFSGPAEPELQALYDEAFPES